MDWFRMYSEARNDAKIRSLSDKEHRVWFNLLCFANEQNARGSINEYEDELLAVEVADGDIELLNQTINRLAKLRILRVSEDGIEFINFKKRNYDNPSDLPDSTRDRKRKQRERENQCHEMSRDVTTSHDIYTDTDTDTDTDINNYPPADENERQSLNQLKNISGYPFDYQKDLDFIRELKTDYPTLNFLKEIKKYSTWVLDNPIKKKSNPRLQIRNWCSKAVEWSGKTPRAAPSRRDQSAYIDSIVEGMVDSG